MEAVNHALAPLSSCEVFEVIEQIAAAKGKEKEAVLAKHMHDETLRQVLRATYDPFTTYGVKKLPEAELVGDSAFGPAVWTMLGELAGRNLTGGAAQTAIKLALESLTEASQTLLRRILTKDMRAGFTEGTCNRVLPGFIFVFECMLAHKFEEKRIKKWPVAAEPKYDGVRSLAIWDDGKVIFYSRTGKVFEGMGPIAQVIAERFKLNDIKPIVLDGELMDKNNSFNKIVGDVHKKDFAVEDAVFRLFDAIPLEHFQADSDLRTYRERRMVLSKLYEDTRLSYEPSVQLAPVRVMKTVAEIKDWAAEIMAQGGEGLIVKPLEGLYEKKRSYNWLKIKAKESIDAVVIDTEEGTGKNEGKIGALVIEVGDVRVNVGTGLSDELRALPPEQVIGRMIEVSYHEKTPDGSLRHPAFERFRDDKPESDGPGV